MSTLTLSTVDCEQPAQHFPCVRWGGFGPTNQVNELHLFAGAGGGILGGMLLGHTCVCAVENNLFRRKVLLQRQRDGYLDWFPIWDDIRTFDPLPWRGCVDVVCGGFPCQDISAAGRGKGLEGERSGLWSQFARVVCEVRPPYVFVENSPMLTVRGLGTVLRDLAQMGYHARWAVLGASDAGLDHRRKRIWILAYARGEFGRSWLRDEGCDRSSSRTPKASIWSRNLPQSESVAATDPVLQSWQKELSAPGLVTVDDGIADVVDQIRAIGDAQVPAVVRLAWETLSQ